MAESRTGSDPRWGCDGRDAKAQAILRTLETIEGPAIAQGTWLDIGCGSGLIAAQLAASVQRIHGVDPELWTRWAELSREYPNLDFHVGSYRDLPSLVQPGSVDVVVCNQVYEHVDSPGELLASVRKSLRVGGICYFAGPNLLWPIEPHVHLPLVHWIPRAWALRGLQMLGDERHRDLDAWSLDLWRLRKLFSRGGFSARSAFVARARAGVEVGEAGALMRAAASLPPALEAAVQPVVPGFVFVLRKDE